jgi:hypothetical protein
MSSQPIIKADRRTAREMSNLDLATLNRVKVLARLQEGIADGCNYPIALALKLGIEPQQIVETFQAHVERIAAGQSK